MSIEERNLLERFAAGEWSLREEASAIYTSWSERFDPESIHHLLFMSEVIEPSDLGKRMAYRSILIEMSGRQH